MAIECVERAARQAGFDLSAIGTVFGSAYGEIRIAVTQLDMMLEGDGIVSPALFKNSVHNTAAGILSIAAKNRGFTTSLAAGDHTLAATLLEAMVAIETGVAKEVIATVADEPPPEPLRSAKPEARFDAIGAAFALTREPAGAIAELTLLPGVHGEAMIVAPGLRENPCCAAAGLIERIEGRTSGTFVLSRPPAQAWSVKLECTG
jgi:hypothetical protein